MTPTGHKIAPNSIKPITNASPADGGAGLPFFSDFFAIIIPEVEERWLHNLNIFRKLIIVRYHTIEF